LTSLGRFFSNALETLVDFFYEWENPSDDISTEVDLLLPPNRKGELRAIWENHKEELLHKAKDETALRLCLF